MEYERQLHWCANLLARIHQHVYSTKVHSTKVRFKLNSTKFRYTKVPLLVDSIKFLSTKVHCNKVLSTKVLIC
jgi:hypothetical protein